VRDSLIAFMPAAPRAEATKDTQQAEIAHAKPNDATACPAAATRHVILSRF
jgi:hypothetical protein